MENLQPIITMLKDIDGRRDRTALKSHLGYDRKTLNYIIKMGYVAVIGNEVTRKYSANNGYDFLLL
jgi:hypothetical protein